MVDTGVGGLRVVQGQVGQGQVGQVAGFLFGKGDEGAGDVMRLAERQARGADQPVGQIGGGEKAGSVDWGDCRSATTIGEDNQRIVGRHLDRFAQTESRGVTHAFKISNITHTPRWVARL